MIQVSTMPKTGQFVAVWKTLDDKIWSFTYKWYEDELYTCSSTADEFINEGDEDFLLTSNDIKEVTFFFTE